MFELKLKNCGEKLLHISNENRPHLVMVDALQKIFGYRFDN